MILYPQGRDQIYVRELQSDVHQTEYEMLECFAQRIQSLPSLYVYRMTNERLWHSCGEGFRASDVISFLRTHSEHPLPMDMQKYVVSTMSKWQKLRFTKTDGGLALTGEAALLKEVSRLPALKHHIQACRRDAVGIPLGSREAVQALLAREGYHVQEDHPSTAELQEIQVAWKCGKTLRSYQQQAVDQFVTGRTHSGVIVLPCGAGKTVVGVGIVERLKAPTLILVPNEASAEQWRTHVLEWLEIPREAVAIDDGRAELASITITTYQRLTARRRSGEHYQFDRYTRYPWGLIIFDEVHLLPAPLFRLAAELCTRRRVGLSATLVREDGRVSDVFSLVGPKCFEVHAEDLVRLGYLSAVECIEVRVPLSVQTEKEYAAATLRARHRIAADNVQKLRVVDFLCQQHRDDKILIMGHYTEFLSKIAKVLACPILTGVTSKEERLDTYARFRQGSVSHLVLSRIANVAVDLPNADVAIQVSGLFGSRQEEAQRLGRILRPKATGGRFYTLVSSGTVEEQTARHRQRFLIEHGFAYKHLDAPSVVYERDEQT